jgi:5'-3' exonuclease
MTCLGLSHRDIATGVIFGFISRILSLSKAFSTNDFVFFWDSRHSYRRERYSWYKQRRKPEELTKQERAEFAVAFRQFNKLRRTILPRIGFANVFLQRGCEADDLIAQYIRNYPVGDYIIVSADEDLYQLLCPYVRMFSPSRQKMMTKGRLLDEYGVVPKQWIDVKCLAGCRSDKVPGIRGIGEKTAIKYLTGKLKPTSKAWSSITSKQGKAVVKRNRWLVELPLPNTRESKLVYRSDTFDLKEFKMVCRKYGMRSFLDRIDEWQDLFYGRVAERKVPKVVVGVRSYL